MPICSMCRKELPEMNDVLENGSEICPECAKQFDIIMESNDYQAVHSAFNYIYTCSEQAINPDVRQCLHSFLNRNASVLDELGSQKGQRGTPVDFSKMEDYTEQAVSDDNYETGSYRDPGICFVFIVLAWIIWIGGLILAINAAFSAIWILGQHGFLAFLVVFAAAIVCGCFPMAVALIIRYLAQIAWNTKELLKKRNNA